MLISKSENLIIQIVRSHKLAVFTWRGSTPSDVFRQGTIESLETLRAYPNLNRIVLNASNYQEVIQDDIIASVNSTVDYLGVAKGNYKMAVILPRNILAKHFINQYVDMLNEALKTRFVVRKFETIRQSLSWLVMPTLTYFISQRVWS